MATNRPIIPEITAPGSGAGHKTFSLPQKPKSDLLDEENPLAQLMADPPVTAPFSYANDASTKPVVAPAQPPPIPPATTQVAVPLPARPADKPLTPASSRAAPKVPPIETATSQAATQPVPMGNPGTPPPRVPPPVNPEAGKETAKLVIADLIKTVETLGDVKTLIGVMTGVEGEVHTLSELVKKGDKEALKNFLTEFYKDIDDNLYKTMKKLLVSLDGDSMKRGAVSKFDDVILNLDTVRQSLSALIDPESPAIAKMGSQLSVIIQEKLKELDPHLVGIRQILDTQLIQRKSEVQALSESLRKQEGLLGEMAAAGKITAEELTSIEGLIAQAREGLAQTLGDPAARHKEVLEGLADVKKSVETLAANPPAAAASAPAASALAPAQKPAAPAEKPAATGSKEAAPTSGQLPHEKTPPAAEKAPPLKDDKPSPAQPCPPACDSPGSMVLTIGDGNNVTIGGWGAFTRGQRIIAGIAVALILIMCGAYMFGKPTPRYGDADMRFQRNGVKQAEEVKEISEGDFKVKLASADLTETQLETCLLDNVIKVKETAAPGQVTPPVQSTLEKLIKDKPDDKKWSEGLAYFYDHIAPAEQTRLGSAFPGVEKLPGSARVASGGGAAIGEFGIIPSSAQWACNLNKSVDMNPADGTCNPYDPKEGRAIALVLTRKHIAVAHEKVEKAKQDGGTLPNAEFVQTIAMGLADYSGNGKNREPDALKYANLAVTQCMKMPPLTKLYINANV